MLRKAMIGACAAAALAPVVCELRVGRATRPHSDRWRHVPVEPRGSTRLGISFRTLQAEAFGLDVETTLRKLVGYPFDVVRLGAYWNRMEPTPGTFRPDELDRQLDIAERAGKQVIVCVGAVKAFGYPEFFVPGHHLRSPLREGTLVWPAEHRELHRAAAAFVARVVRRYRDRESIIAWQVEHEPVDPLGMEHSWRLSTAFVQQEVDAVRAADPSRPVMMSGFLATSLPVRLQQWWRTRDQGDSLAVAEQLADIVGLDFYPRHALVGLGRWAAYLDGSGSPWQRRSRKRLLARAAAQGRVVAVAEGQAEPWEAVTVPPSPDGETMSSCPPERVVQNYNQCMRWGNESSAALHAYLFWGAEYWVVREAAGDPRYLAAFARVLERSKAGRPLSGSAPGS